MAGNRLINYTVRNIILHVLTAALLIIPMAAIYFTATENTMGDLQRILYVHVPVAWFGLVAFLAMALAGAMYLRSRDLRWDHWSQAAAEVGWLCMTLTILTGALWAHAAWNTWWTWDPRLTAVFILWAITSAYLLLRSNLDDPLQSARFRAVAAIIGALDLPMIVMATRWFRGMHPQSPEMESGMKIILWIGIAAYSLLFTILIVRRRTQLDLASHIASLQQEQGLNGIS